MNFTESNVHIQTHILPFILAQWDCNPITRIMENTIPTGVIPPKMILSKTIPDISYCSETFNIKDFETLLTFLDDKFHISVKNCVSIKMF